MKTIALGSDHAGFALKDALVVALTQRGFAVQDCGTFSADSCDYPDYARKVANLVSSKKIPGLLVCGSGIGVSIVANKVRGVRAALVFDVDQACLSKQHNDSNVLCFAGRLLDAEQALKIIDVWLSTEFEGGRHARRVQKIEAPRAGESQDEWSKSL